MQIDYSNIPNKLELHYCFTDDDHTMDAIIRNSCERELLAIVNEIASLLEVESLRINSRSASFLIGELHNVLYIKRL